ncbi:MAG TPA: hypothetical protein VFQ13_23770 [Anaerolineales bacterium]|nr:hypothetical protein [Anaerolineales bacterium]
MYTFFIALRYSSATQRLALPAGGRDETTHLVGTNFEPQKLPENAATPTRRVHAVLGGFPERQTAARNQTSPPTGSITA